MAIAPLPDVDENGESGRGARCLPERVGAQWGTVEVPWPRPLLRAVRDGWDETERTRGRAVEPSTPVAFRQGDDGARRRRHVLVQRRRRALFLGVVVVALVTGLALPVRALGGAPAAPPSAAHLAGATVYVVQPGDTIWSIAERFDRGGDPRPMAEALARETGSARVVPGERIPIP